MLHALIMAGGSGTRFWPRSRRALPKQLIRIGGAQTMIQEVVERLAGLLRPEQMLILTNQAQVDETQRQLPGFPAANIIGEPQGRDTAAAAGFGAILVRQRDPDAVMVVTPADHRIEPASRFHAALQAAASLAARDHVLVTFGIRPTGPATIYGYLERGEAVPGAGEAAVFRVARFREKPDAATAEQLVHSGKCYWNSGIFVWRVADILAAIRRHMPELYAGLERLAGALSTPAFAAVLAAEYPRLPKTSVDYGIMEKADNVAVLEADFAWDDVGSWEALARIHGADSSDNTVEGNQVAVDTKNSIIATSGRHLVATLGVSNLIVVHTEDATLICDRSRAADVKALVEELRRRGLQSYL